MLSSTALFVKGKHTSISFVAVIEEMTIKVLNILNVLKLQLSY